MVEHKKAKIQTLKEILDLKYGNIFVSVHISWRLYHPVCPQKLDCGDVIDGLIYYNEHFYEDIFFGECTYDFQTGKLIPDDGDSYSLDEKIYKYEIDTSGNLTVWSHPCEQIVCFNDYDAGFRHGIKHAIKEFREMLMSSLDDLENATYRLDCEKAVRNLLEKIDEFSKKNADK